MKESAVNDLVIRMIKKYQEVAPRRIREACRFTPSCSEYMILSLKKYGLFDGLILGLKRWSRCHPPNGGIDNP